MPEGKIGTVVTLIALGLAMPGPALAQDETDVRTGLMIRQTLNIASALELSGAAVCILTNTQAELDVAEYFASSKMEYSPVVFDRFSDMIETYSNSRCDAVAGPASELEDARISLANPGDHLVLPERLGLE